MPPIKVIVIGNAVRVTSTSSNVQIVQGDTATDIQKEAFKLPKEIALLASQAREKAVEKELRIATVASVKDKDKEKDKGKKPK